MPSSRLSILIRYRQKLLSDTWRRFAGVCQRCRAPVVPLFVARAKGWDVYEKRFRAVSPAGVTHLAASVEHIKPKAAGGGDDPDHTPLYCHYCNMDANRAYRAAGAAYMRVEGRYRRLERMRWADDGGYVPDYH